MQYRVFGATQRNKDGVLVGPAQVAAMGGDLPLPGWSRKILCPCCDRKIVIRCEGEPLSADDEQYLREMSH